MKTKEFTYELPQELIAQTPLIERDASRLLVLHRDTGNIEDRKFKDLFEYLKKGDILIANDSRVIPARIYGHKNKTGGRVEFLLLSQIDPTHWLAMVGGKKLFPGVEVTIHDKLGKDTTFTATIKKVANGSLREIEFSQPTSVFLERVGYVPLPPYIHKQLDNPERYQTIYCNIPGSAAAPTAGLHFTKEILKELQSQGIFFDTCTLHVGLDTFKPVTAENIDEHVIHSEWIVFSNETARRINEVRSEGGRVIAVGTTTARVLETVGLRSIGISGSLQNASQNANLNENDLESKKLIGYEGLTDLYIFPGYKFRVVDALLTNFHLPGTSLMMMIAAFANLEQVKSAYNKAMELKYRFLSLGDTMLIL